MSYQVVAPGKVMVVGEYAVVDGAPAVVAAVDRGVRCTVTPGDAVRIETPGDDRFVRPALAGAPPATYRFEDHNPVDLPSKPGLGGSAAAVVCAVLARSPGLSPAELFAEAFRVHRQVQGSGSGTDVAASSWGGVLRFQAGHAARLAPIEPVVVWSGASAKTGPRVERYLAWTGRRAFVERSTEVVEAFSGDPVAALRSDAELLDRMSREAGVPYWTEALLRIRHLAQEAGGAAKPSGAGGGDVAIALFDDREARARFEAACVAEGLPVIPVRLADGAHVVPQEPDART